MTKTKVFIDGKAGTTGLKIFDRLEQRNDIEILTLSEQLRKDVCARKQIINSADVVFLCLPDDAARESVSLVENDSVKVIDASTAHRTQADWAYGFPELSEQFRSRIKSGKRVAVPGCHATGFLSLVYPLLKSGILPKDYPLVSNAITGYSGGGNAMIGEYEKGGDIALKSPRQYALGQMHKHLKEMQTISGLQSTPIFTPVVSDFYCGLQVTVPLYSRLLKSISSPRQMREFLEDYYSGQKLVTVLGEKSFESGFVPSNILAEKDNLQIFVGGNDERILLIALLDNLGKGASGAAVQCLNIMLGKDETTGLIV